MELFWIWLILGFALLAAELLSGTFVILFFGIGALLTSAVAIFSPAPLALQILIFSLVSLALMLIFRRRFITPVTADEKKSLLSADINTEITLSETLAAHGEAMIAYQGTHWTAVNLESEELKQGTRVRVDRTEGIKLFVRKN